VVLPFEFAGGFLTGLGAGAALEVSQDVLEVGVTPGGPDVVIFTNMS
jgi:hypothetical protein